MNKMLVAAQIYSKEHDVLNTCCVEMILLHGKILRAICSPLLLRPGAESACEGGAV